MEKRTREELIARVNSLHNDCTAQRGKINDHQMLSYCTKWADRILGRLIVKRMFLGRLFGRLALKGVLKNDKPLDKNSPTANLKCNYRQTCVL